jgi:hypothetical protein
MSEKKDEEKKDDEKEEEDEEEEEEEEEEESSSEDEGSGDPRIDENMSNEARGWCRRNFNNDLTYARYYAQAKDRSQEEIMEMKKLRTWQIKIR